MFKPVDSGSFVEELEEYANERVGQVGNPTCEAHAVTGELYSCLRIEVKDAQQVKEEWGKAIEVAIKFASIYANHPFVEIPSLPLSIYWRLKPDITEINGKLYLCARFLISAQKGADGSLE